MTANYDVVVVGGRVAGASTAMLLARAGARVALVDRAGHGTDTVSTHGLMRAGVLQLSRWGLLDDVVAAGTPPIEQTTFHYADGDSVEVGIRPTPGIPALYAPRRYLLDRILVDAAAAAGVHVRHEATVTALLRDENARVTGVRIADRDGTTADLRAAITVGADGLRSGVATEAGAEIIRRGRSCSAMLYRYYAGLSATGYEWAYGSGDAAGFIPTNGGLTGVFVGTMPARLRTLRRDGTQHAFATLLAKAAPRLAERVASAEPVGRMHGWAGVPGFVRQSWGSGWALVGDAGYFKDPITTHGMTDALRDAELLADEILETLTGMVPEDVALKRYQAMRDQLSTRLFEATEPIASYAWDLDQVRALLRQASSAMRQEVEHLESLPNPHTNEPLAHLSVRNTAYC
jgi:2-polyprenyl-6-methoxyphenol hydroxylase-like FAD-dependent oxidoreductase